MSNLDIPAFVLDESISADSTLYQQNLPALTELTMCFWLQGELKDEGKQSIFSLGAGMSCHWVEVISFQ